MCLAIPGEVIHIGTGDVLQRMATVRFGAIEKSANLAFVPEARVGDYVLVHAGIAISRIDPAQAQRTLDYLQDSQA